MRIVEIVHAFPPLAEGGCETYAEAHACALVRSGDEVLVLAREADRARPEYAVRSEVSDGLRIIRINNTFASTRSFADSYRNDAIARLALREIDEFKPDVAHVHHLTGLCTTIVQELSGRSIPCFMTLHDYWLICHRGQLFDLDQRVCNGPDGSSPCRRCLGFQGAASASAYSAARAWRRAERLLPESVRAPIRERLNRLAQQRGRLASTGEDIEMGRRVEHMRRVIAHVSEFFAPSEWIRERFVRFGVAPDRIFHWVNGLDRTLFEPSRMSRRPRVAGQPLRVGFIGSLMVSKAPHLAIEAVRDLRGAASLDLFGSLTPYHGDRSYLDRLGPLLTAEGIRHRGPVEHRQIPKVLGSLDVLVVPSIWPENSPLVIQEAFAAGVPVIASRIGGIPELVEHGRNGLLFEPGNLGDLRQAIGRVADDPQLLEGLRRGIGSMRGIDDDVKAARERYVHHVRQPRASPGRAATIAAVVLNYRTAADTYLAVRSIAASRRGIDTLIVVDNDDQQSAGGADCRALLGDQRPDGLIYLRNYRNLGFSGGVNVGIRAALDRGADAVLLLNSDVVLPPDCIGRLERSLYDSANRYGVVGPAIVSRAYPGRLASVGMRYNTSTGRMKHDGVGGIWPQQTNGNLAIRRVDGVSACAMLIRREVFDSIGFFDEDYFFSFEDLDFCLRACHAGFETGVVEAAVAYHEGGQSLGAASLERFYFAARNHLLLGSRTKPGSSAARRLLLTPTIILLNIAHAFRANGGTLPARLGAVVRGVRDYAAGRFGPG
jgi:GT2 family glycosyltransferase/glycosyltransferase involved in cell wall biosynthesis